MKGKKRVLIEIGHPAHVHQFKHLYWELSKKGWEGLFVAKEKECSIDLLKYYHLPYVSLGANRKGVLRKVLSLPCFAFKYIKISWKYKPDVFISRVSPLSGYASFILRKSHITFTDTENVKLMDSISEPFTDVILTSTVYLRNHRKNQLRYPGYHELAYLHPNRFKPNNEVLSRLGVNNNEKYAVVRFVSWDAHHDIGHKGLTVENKIRLVKELSKYLKVFISSEGELPDELQEYQIKIKPEQMHDVLYFSSFFIGESGTMASECAVLGVPAIFLNNKDFGCILDQASYGLLYKFTESSEDQERSINKAIELAQLENVKAVYAGKRDEMLRDKIDVTSFMVWLVENYPVSVEKMKKDSFGFERFR